MLDFGFSKKTQRFSSFHAFTYHTWFSDFREMWLYWYLIYIDSWLSKKSNNQFRLIFGSCGSRSLRTTGYQGKNSDISPDTFFLAFLTKMQLHFLQLLLLNDLLMSMPASFNNTSNICTHAYKQPMKVIRFGTTTDANCICWSSFSNAAFLFSSCQRIINFYVIEAWHSKRSHQVKAISWTTHHPHLRASYSSRF